MTTNPTMDSIIFEIAPSARDKNKHRGLGFLSAIFGLILTLFIIWAAMQRQIGLWTILILAMPVMLFAAVSWFVLRFGKDYVQGIQVFPDGIGKFYPLNNTPGRRDELILFQTIQKMEFEENLEVHRVGRRIKSINVYRIRILKLGEEKPELFADMINLLPEQVIKFRQLPGFLTSNQLLSAEQVDISQMP